jgi:hypothetical protein
MANTYEDPSIFAKEALRRLWNSLRFAKLVNRSYEKEFRNVGPTISVRRPVYLKSVQGPDITGKIQNVVQTHVDLTVLPQRTVPVQIDVRDWTLSDVDFENTVIQPAAGELANYLDMTLANLALKIPNAVGTAGTTPNTSRHFALVQQRMDKMLAPDDDRSMVIDSDVALEIGDNLKGLFAPNITQPIVQQGYLGKTLSGFNLFTSQNLPSHTKGTATGTPLTNGAGQGSTSTNAGVTTLITDGWTASLTPCLRLGDVFTVGSVCSINPRNKLSTGELRQFVVTADVNSDSSGNCIIPISPPLNGNTDSPYQNVDASPGDGIAISVVASHSVNVGFHRDAFTLATIEIKTPTGFAYSKSVNFNGIGITVSSDSDILTYSQITRLDIMFAADVINPDLACILMGKSR